MIYYRKHMVDKNNNKIKDKDGKFKFTILDTNNKIVINKEVLDYINKLIMPPAYNDVSIFYIKKLACIV